MLLLLVRHAETAVTGTRLTGWLPGFHLSPAGRRQAEAVAERLALLPLRAVYTSPLERCAETAEAIAGRHGLDTQVLEGLGEVRYGDWQGRPLKALYRTKAWRELVTHPADFRFPGGETIRETQTRAVTTVQSLLERHSGEAVVAVSHADVIRLLVAAYLGLGLDLYQRTSIAPASLTAILLGDRIPHVLRVSDAGSVDDLGKRLRPASPRRAAVGSRGRKNRSS